MGDRVKYALRGVGVSKTFVGSADVRRAQALEVAPLAELAETRYVRVNYLGDSMSQAVTRRKRAMTETRRLTGRIEFVGTIGHGAGIGGFQGDLSPLSWEHDGVNSDTVAMVEARVDAWYATLAAEGRLPDVVVLQIGTNDAAGLRTVAQYEADMRSLLGKIRALLPNLWIVLCVPPPIMPGTSSGVNYAAKEAFRAAYATVLATLANEIPTCVLINGYEGIQVGEYNGDGIHPEDAGYSRPALAEARALMALVGQNIYTLPVRDPWVPHGYACIELPNASAATAAGTIPATEDMSPENQDFAVCVRFVVDTLPGDAAVNSIVSMGTTIADGYLLGVYKAAGATKMGLAFYLGYASPVINGGNGPGAGASNAGLITIGAEHEVLVICNRATGKVGMWLDGQTVYIVDLASARPESQNWNLAVHATKIGRGSLTSLSGRVRAFEFYKGANVPSVKHGARLAEEKRRHGIFLPGLMAHYPMNAGTGSPTDRAGKGGAMVLSGGAVWGTINTSY